MDRLLGVLHSAHSVVKIPILKPGTTMRAPPADLRLLTSAFHPDRICVICGQNRFERIERSKIPLLTIVR